MSGSRDKEKIIFDSIKALGSEEPKMGLESELLRD
jgi:hypothetical protein